MAKITELRVNGKIHKIDADPERILLGFLRDELGLTGTKYGCGEGQCGACTILVGGTSARSCQTTLASTTGKEITTIEGVEQDGRLHPLQEAFLELDAFQCGYCTPGMIMSGLSLLRKNPHPSRNDTIRYMEGNICRCGTYLRILAAIEKAAGTEAQK